MNKEDFENVNMGELLDKLSDLFDVLPANADTRTMVYGGQLMKRLNKLSNVITGNEWAEEEYFEICEKTKEYADYLKNWLDRHSS